MSGYVPRKVSNARMRTKTNQTGLKMQGSASMLGRRNYIQRYVNRRVQPNVGVCGYPHGYRCINGVEPIFDSTGALLNPEAVKQNCKLVVNGVNGINCVDAAPKNQGLAGGVGRINVPRFHCGQTCFAGKGHPHFRPGGGKIPPGPKPMGKINYEFYYGGGTQKQQIMHRSGGGSVLINVDTSSLQDFELVNIVRINTDGTRKTVWTPNSNDTILQNVTFAIKQIGSTTLLNKTFEQLITFNTTDGTIAFNRNNAPSPPGPDYSESKTFSFQVICKFKDPVIKDHQQITKIENGSITVKVVKTPPGPPQPHEGLIFDVIYTNSKPEADLRSLLNNSDGATTKTNVNINFKALMINKSFELAPNFVQVAATSGLSKSGNCAEGPLEGSSVVIAPSGTANVDFPVAGFILQQAQAYFSGTPTVIKKGATFAGTKSLKGTVHANNFDYGNPEFVKYFEHATGIQEMVGWPKWTLNSIPPYLNDITDLKFILSFKENNQSLVTKQTTTPLPILEKGACVFISESGGVQQYGYKWPNSDNSATTELLGLYDLKIKMVSFPPIYYSGGESHASAPIESGGSNLFGKEVTYSAIQNYETNTTGYCATCTKPPVPKCKSCAGSQPPPPFSGEFGKWINSFDFLSNKDTCHSVAHSVVNQMFTCKDSNGGCYGGTTPCEKNTWLPKLNSANGFTIPVIAVGGKGGSADIGFPEILIPYLLYEMNEQFKKLSPSNRPKKVALYHSAEKFSGC